MRHLLAAGLLVATVLGWSGASAAERFIIFKVDNMTCALCSITVQTAFESVPGVTKVTISRRESTATVIYDDAATDPAELAAASTNAGYPATAIAQ